MIKNIKLRQSIGIVEDKEPFVIVDNDNLVLEFQTNTKASEFIVAIQTDKTNKFKIKGTSFTVPKEFIKAGVLDVVVSQMEKATAVKEWHIEPILIKAVDFGFIGTLEFETLLQKYGKLLEIFDTKTNEIIDTVNLINKRVEELATEVEK